MKQSHINGIAIALAILSAFLIGRMSVGASDVPTILKSDQQIKAELDEANENFKKFIISAVKPKTEDTSVKDVQLVRVLQYNMKADGLQPMDTNWVLVAQKGSVQTNTQGVEYKDINGDTQHVKFKKSDAREVLVSSVLAPNQLEYRFESKLPIK